MVDLDLSRNTSPLLRRYNNGSSPEPGGSSRRPSASYRGGALGPIGLVLAGVLVGVLLSHVAPGSTIKATVLTGAIAKGRGATARPAAYTSGRGSAGGGAAASREGAGGRPTARGGDESGGSSSSSSTGSRASSSSIIDSISDSSSSSSSSSNSNSNSNSGGGGGGSGGATGTTSASAAATPSTSSSIDASGSIGASATPAAPVLKLERATWGPEGRLGLQGGHTEVCRLDYSIKDWEGKLVKVCNMTKCEGRENMTLMSPPEKKEELTRRWNDSHEDWFRAAIKKKGAMEGWLHPPQVDFVKHLTRKQHELGIFGSVGEIGVHHGKFFLTLAGQSAVSEPLFAMDLFEGGQEANVDKSGKGSKDKFFSNLRRFGIDPSNVTVKTGNSHRLTAVDFLKWGLPAFRIFSVDGGHSMETTLNDLMVASCIVREGGIVILDDFPMPTWMGVAEALAHFTHAQDRLVPFLTGWNKVYLATSSHAAQYRELAASMPDVFACRKFHPSKVAMGGSQTCFTGPSKV